VRDGGKPPCTPLLHHAVVLHSGRDDRSKELRAGSRPNKAPAIQSCTAVTMRSVLRILILCKAAIDPCNESSCCPNAAHLNLLPSPRFLSTDLAANVKPDPGTLRLPKDLGEQMTPTWNPCPNARSRLRGCPVLGRFPSTNATDSPHVAERWLTFRATLVLDVSGGPDLDFPHHDADTLLRWPISRPTSTSWGFYRFVVTAQHHRIQIAIVRSGGPDARVRVTYFLRSKTWHLRAITRVTFRFQGLLTFSCWRICPVLGHDDKVLNSSVPQIDVETLSTAPAACSLHAQFFEAH